MLVLLELSRLRCSLEAETRRLLRLLQLRQRALPSGSGRTLRRLRMTGARLAVRGVDQLFEDAAVGDAVTGGALSA